MPASNRPVTMQTRLGPGPEDQSTLAARKARTTARVTAVPGRANGPDGCGRGRPRRGPRTPTPSARAHTPRAWASTRSTCQGTNPAQKPGRVSRPAPMPSQAEPSTARGGFDQPGSGAVRAGSGRHGVRCRQARAISAHTHSTPSTNSRPTLNRTGTVEPPHAVYTRPALSSVTANRPTRTTPNGWTRVRTSPPGGGPRSP